MKKCSFFSQNRKLVVIIVRGAFFIVEEVLSNCRSTSMVARLNTKITSLIWTQRNVWLSTNQNVLTFSPAAFAINTSPSTPGFILAITPKES